MILNYGGMKLLGQWRSHLDYRQYVAQELQRRWPVYQQSILQYQNGIKKLWLLNLDDLRGELALYYASTGRPAENQPEILRSLVMMVECREDSIDSWVGKLRNDDILAIICGFEPGNIPGVATYYDFLDRFWLAPKPGRVRKFKRKPKGKLKAGEKLPPKHPEIVKRIVKRLLRGRRFESRPEKVLHRILAVSVVLPSAQMGLLGDPKKLAISGDGSLYATGGSPYGKKICQCKEQCDCKRRFSDPEANWGWDSYRERWVFGYTVYELTAADSFHDLPIYIGIGQASRHDSVLGLRALSELRVLYPHFVFAKFIADSAHDAYPWYELLHSWQLEPFIDLNTRKQGKLSLPGFTVDKDGSPICAAGFPMVNWGYCASRRRIKWRCPLVCGKVKHCPQQCSPSQYGRVVYTKPEWDLRLFTKTPRNSKAWKEVYARRSASERTNKRQKIDYQLERTRARGKRRTFWRLTLGAINQHLDAWIAESKITLAEIIGIEQVA